MPDTPTSTPPRQASRAARAVFDALKSEPVQRPVGAAVNPASTEPETAARAAPPSETIAVPNQPKTLVVSHKTMMMAGSGAVILVLAAALLPRLISTPSPPVTETPKPIVSVAPHAIQPAQVEIAFWQSIQNSAEPKDFGEYLMKFPSGEFAGLARNKIAALTAPAPKPSPAPTSVTSQTPITVPEPPTIFSSPLPIAPTYTPPPVSMPYITQSAPPPEPPTFLYGPAQPKHTSTPSMSSGGGSRSR